MRRHRLVDHEHNLQVNHDPLLTFNQGEILDRGKISFLACTRCLQTTSQDQLQPCPCEKSALNYLVRCRRPYCMMITIVFPKIFACGLQPSKMIRSGTVKYNNCDFLIGGYCLYLSALIKFLPPKATKKVGA